MEANKDAHAKTSHLSPPFCILRIVDFFLVFRFRVFLPPPFIPLVNSFCKIPFRIAFSEEVNPWILSILRFKAMGSHIWVLGFFDLDDEDIFNQLQ